MWQKCLWAEWEDSVPLGMGWCEQHWLHRTKVYVQSPYAVRYVTTIGDNKNDYIPVKRVHGKPLKKTENRTV